MTTKRQLREQIIHLNHRIEDLEERLCPCESHQWKLINSFMRIVWNDCERVYIYKCARCGKKIETYIQKEESNE